MSLGELDGSKRFSSNEIELVDFRINEIRNNEIYEGIYGINVSKVQEIIQMPEVTELPASEEYVVGVFDLRGTIMPLIDLAIWLGIKENEAKIENSRKRVLVTEFSNFKIGFIVHEAKLIRRISWDDVKPALFSSNANNHERNKITGTTMIDDGLTLLMIDLESIIDDLDFYKDVKPKSLEDSHIDKKLSGHVLIVDDSVVARSMIKKNLQQMGFDVIEAKDGQAGLNALEELYDAHQNNLGNFLSLIVSDVEMPRMDGFHFAESVRRDKRFDGIPIIFNSSICDKYSEEKSRNIGVHSYLVKFDANTFYNEVLKVISLKDEQ